MKADGRPEQGLEGEQVAAGAAAPEAVSRLFAEHNASLLRFLRLRLGSDQEARDIAQEAYVRILQLRQPGAVSFLRAYLFKIANNLATDRLRGIAVRRSAHADPIFDLGEDELGPDRQASARQQLALIEAGLQELPDHVRTAFLLHRLDDLSAKDIGHRLAVTERTAHNYIVRAMVHCRAKLDDREPDVPGATA